MLIRLSSVLAITVGLFLLLAIVQLIRATVPRFSNMLNFMEHSGHPFSVAVVPYFSKDSPNQVFFEDFPDFWLWLYLVGAAILCLIAVIIWNFVAHNRFTIWPK